MIQKIKNILFLFLCICISSLHVQAQEAEREIIGRVLSAANNSPLPGINVAIPGISAAMTNDEGEFKLKVTSSDVELLISGPMYQSKRVALKGRNSIVIKMQEEGFEASSYKDVLTPLGTINNSHLTSSAVFLDGNKNAVVGDMPESLLGEVAGLNTVFRSGMEGSGANLFLNGFGSIYANTQPLLVIDGMILENQQFGSSLVEGYFSTPLGAIDIKDIESITVLKDATAIYGVKGANGVILIQTKRTTDLATRINIQVLAGLSLQPQKTPMLNASQSKRYLEDMVQNTGKYTSGEIQNMPFVNMEKPVSEKWGYSGNRDYYRYNQNTDWQDEIFQEAFKQQYSLDVSGGDETAIYGLSLGFLQKDGVVKNTDYNRFNARINTGIIFSPKMKVNTNMSFIYGKKNLANEGVASYLNPMYSALVKSPFTTINVLNEENMKSPNYEDVDFFGNANPAVVTDNVIAENSFYRFIGNMDFYAELAKNLSFTTNFGIDFNKEREKIFYPKGGVPYDDITLSAVTNMQQHRVERLFTLFDESRLTYLQSFAHDHKLSGTVGFRYMTCKAENDYGKGFNSSSNYYVSIAHGSNKLYQTGGALGNWNWLAFYGNVNYNLRNKYFVDATVSFDASSRYGSGIADYQTYPSLTAAWLLSSEKWFKVDFVDMFKIRAGYTQSGNDGIGNYSAKRYYVAQNFLGNFGLVRGNLVNEDLKPERSNKFNVGLDMAFFNEALTVNADFYTNKITDLLVYSDAESWTGFSKYIDNGGEMKNTGMDFAVNGRLINTKEWKWDLGFTISHYKNEVKKLKTGSFNTEIADGIVRTQVGSPLGVFFGYKTNGVYASTVQAQEEGLSTMIGTQKTAFSGGDVRFVDSYNDGIIDEKDMQVIGDPNPDIFGSVNTNLKWKRFNLSAMFRYSVGNDVYNYTRRNLESMSGYQNQTEAALNRWRKEGQITDMPRLAYGDPMGNSRFSDRWIEDGSYFKLKNLTLSYNVPLRSNVLTDLMVYGAAENLFTITSYKGYDPEVISSSTNPLNYGIDAFATPHTCTFYMGVKIGL